MRIVAKSAPCGSTRQRKLALLYTMFVAWVKHAQRCGIKLLALCYNSIPITIRPDVRFHLRRNDAGSLQCPFRRMRAVTPTGERTSAAEAVLHLYAICCPFLSCDALLLNNASRTRYETRDSG
jgi:hypothetical protein